MNRKMKSITTTALMLTIPAGLLIAGTGCEEEQLLRQVVGVAYEYYQGGIDAGSTDDGGYWSGDAEDSGHDNWGHEDWHDGGGWEDDGSHEDGGGDNVQIIPPRPIPG